MRHESIAKSSQKFLIVILCMEEQPFRLSGNGRRPGISPALLNVKGLSPCFFLMGTPVILAHAADTRQRHRFASARCIGTTFMHRMTLQRQRCCLHTHDANARHGFLLPPLAALSSPLLLIISHTRLKQALISASHYIFFWFSRAHATSYKEEDSR